jgi:predicted amidohydrolase YtcJ
MQTLRWRLSAGGLVIAVGLFAAPAEAAQCSGGRYQLLTNGRIHTMDAQRSVVSRVLVAKGKFAAVGDAATDAGGCTDTIDLGGRTVIPGMIENHFHVLLVASRPGHETREIESAASIADVQAILRERARGVPAGAFITAIGGLHPRQFKENRLPTLAELDAAASQHAVYIHVRFNGPAATNTLGKKFFESRGVQVSADGLITENAQAWAALNALRATRALEDKKRTLQEVFSYFNKVGLTTVHSVLGSGLEGGAQYFRTTDHLPMLQLLAEDKLTLRLRLAERGWQLMEHSFHEPNHVARADVWKRVNAKFPITDLRWSIDHVNTIELPTIERMKKLGVGIRAHGARYLFGGIDNNGPPYLKILDSGVRVGVGLDGAQAAPINPWMQVYYMVTGIDTTGTLINDGQQISRQEAIWLYTAANGWFSREEDTLGSIEVGKLADLVVLSADFFDEQAIPDQDIRRIHSVLTIVGGKIVHGDPAALRQYDFVRS